MTDHQPHADKLTPRELAERAAALAARRGRPLHPWQVDHVERVFASDEATADAFQERHVDPEPALAVDLATLTDDELDELLRELATQVCRTLRPYHADEQRPPSTDAVFDASRTLDAWALARDERMRRL